MKCSLCNTALIHKKDEFFFDCGTCSALVKDVTQHLTFEEEKAHYECHNNDVHDAGYQKFTAPITDYILNHFSSRDKGLDFGSGTGPVISHMLLQKKYDILPYDPFFAPDTTVLASTYDYILSCEVFEHFRNPKKEIDRLVSMLNPGGALLIMTLLYDNSIDFASWFYKRDPTHIFLYRKETIAFIAQEYRLEITVLDERLIVLEKPMSLIAKHR